MSLLYRLEKNNNAESAAYGKYYAKAVMTGDISTDELANIMQENCTVKRSDIKAVLTELGSTMTRELQNSHRVIIDGLGAFKLGISSKGVINPEEFDVKKHLKNVHVNFLPASTIDSSGTRIKTFVGGAKVKEAPLNTLVKKKSTSVNNGNGEQNS